MASKRRQRRARERAKGASPSAPRRVFWLPFALTVALALLTTASRIQESPVLLWSFWSAALTLVVFQLAVLWRLDESAGRFLRVEVRRQHYIQAAVQFSVYAYWGYYWRPVYEYAWLLVGQLLFVYAFDMLLSWSRRDTYVLGFGPFPIVFSTNLFLWFKDDWFYLQFAMIAVGVLGKEFVRWNRDGRSVHIFNPSAFTLSLFGLALIATNTTGLTWGQEIASTLSLAPHIYLFLFSIGLVVMYFFWITPIAATASAVLFGASALYSAATGVPYFVDSEIPTAVFLGLHLLVTDPSTSPRSTFGKLLFGTMYGLGVVILYALLGAMGAPTFYDKLLSVPLLNLSVRGIDRFVRAVQENRHRLVREPARANLVYMTIWATFFGAMTAVGATDGVHRGDTVPFWEEACAEDRRNACERLLSIESTYCGDNSGWACNELGRHYAEGKLTTADAEAARRFFARACELRFEAGCVNLLDPETPLRSNPRLLDLRLLLRAGGGNLMEMPEPQLYARACEHRWTFACQETRARSGGESRE
jgi:hypothetical protein